MRIARLAISETICIFKEVVFIQRTYIIPWSIHIDTVILQSYYYFTILHGTVIFYDEYSLKKKMC